MNNKNIFLLYGSQTGNSEEICKNIYLELFNLGYNAKYSSLNQCINKDLNVFNFIEKKSDEKDIVIIICSTTGNGEAPCNANIFYNKLKNRNQPKDLFNNIQYSILGLGDTNYNKFCEIGKNIDKRFSELGGERLFDLHCADEASNQDEVIEVFIEKIINYCKIL